MKAKFHTIVCTLFLALSAFAQESYQDKKLSPQQLLEDFTLLRNSLEECHPGLYWYRSKAEMDQVFEQANNYLHSPRTEREFVMLLDELFSKIGCLHTVFRASDSLGKSYWKDIKTLPFDMRILGDKAFIHKNRSRNDALKPGTEVLSINDLSVDSIKTLMDKYDASDGYNTTWSITRLQHELGNFLAFYVGKSNTYLLTVVNQTGEVEKVTIDALSAEECKYLKEKRHGVEVAKPKSFINLSFDDETQTAILHIPRFENWKISRKKYEFSKMLKQRMKEIVAANAQHLIIDVGDSGGGNERYGLELLSHLVSKPFTGYKKIEFKQKRFETRKHSSTKWIEYAFFRILLKLKKSAEGTYLLTNHRNTKPYKPSTIHFSGDVYIITSGMTASATSDFAALAHSMKIATFIGEEMGGSYLGNTSNWEFDITLPNTKIVARIPLARYFTNVGAYPHFGRGVMPDYEVIPKMTDILNGVDTQLDFTLDLIRRKAAAAK